jgi:spore coat protein JC
MFRSKFTGIFKKGCCSHSAAEQKARTTYDNILRLADDPDVRDPIRFLRQREIVHFQRFGEALRITQDKLDSRNFYACNPSFDKNCGK